MTPQHVSGRFEEQVDAVGSQLAVHTASDSLTYAEVDARANGIAEKLRDLRAGAGTRVALLTDQEPAGCSALVGILKSGATCVPISQSEPADRVAQILRDADARVVVTHRPYLDDVASLPLENCQVLDLHDVTAVTTRTFPLPDPDGLTLILYTSGSTGRPKGVLQANAGSMQRARRWQEALGITSKDRVTLFATFATGQGSATTLLALLSGATLCPFQVRHEGTTRLSSWLREERVSVYISSVTLLRSLAKNLSDDVGYPDLRLVRFGGERVTPTDMTLIRRRFPRAQLIHTYSASETGNICMYRIPPGARFAEDDAVPVGPPDDEMTVQVISDDGRDAPVGEVGEIVVRGPGLSPGYWNDPERTAQVFRSVAAAPNELACRTGDLGRLRPDGLLEHCGRKDFRIKIRGFRIELEEVEGAIAGHPSVERAAAAAKPQSGGADLVLVAYIQAIDDAGLTPEAVRAYLSTRLPGHMVPSLFVFLDELPLTPSGKLDRKALPDPSTDGPSRSQPYVAPGSPLESSIAEVWKDVLELDVIGIHDHFLEVGGDSLRATQVASRLRDVLDREVPMRDLFEAATIAELATVLQDAQERDPW